MPGTEPKSAVYYHAAGQAPEAVGHARDMDEAYAVIQEHAESAGQTIACFVDHKDGEGTTADTYGGRYEYRLPHAWPLNVTASRA